MILMIILHNYENLLAFIIKKKKFVNGLDFRSMITMLRLIALK